ncbi:triose-phosphate isomerase [Peredibacter starrii]|uniref:Triosephosphate isomerase n=1 Tax=Peredibacter starrii TaxID=28202 RepID=A0AAX4HP65_9BACT|nr:triose-phosphate isomerase [Peredibacter starrii]WPU64887.1 triose-phosphate isomerase [Peredibacter starrii]
MKKLMVGNWKMNKNGKEAQQFTEEFNSKFTDKRDAWIASQALFVKLIINSGIKAGIQNCSEHVNGAYTGEVSPRSFKEMGGHFVILGHSERRQYFGETSKGLNAKIRTALAEGLEVIYCVGETLAEREAGQTLSLIEDQLHQGLNDQSLANATNLIVAYEPVWAIGTGKTASPAQAQEVHAHIRNVLKAKFPAFGDKTRILYGGSVNPANVEELLAQKDIDGGLVGGASLKPADFLALCGDR